MPNNATTKRNGIIVYALLLLGVLMVTETPVRAGPNSGVIAAERDLSATGSVVSVSEPARPCGLAWRRRR